MVLDLCQTGVLADSNTSIFSGVGGIFRSWYRYRNNSNTFWSNVTVNDMGGKSRESQ